MNERCDVLHLFGRKGELMLIRSDGLEERIQHFASVIPHHIIGPQQIGPAVFATARIFAVAVSAVGHVRGLATRDAGGIAGREGRELARTLNRTRRHCFVVSLRGEI